MGGQSRQESAESGVARQRAADRGVPCGPAEGRGSGEGPGGGLFERRARRSGEKGAGIYGDSLLRLGQSRQRRDDRVAAEFGSRRDAGGIPHADHFGGRYYQRSEESAADAGFGGPAGFQRWPVLLRLVAGGDGIGWTRRCEQRVGGIPLGEAGDSERERPL